VPAPARRRGGLAVTGGDLAALQARIQHSFSDPRLLQRALTHRSFSADHNERLEFLGDSVLNLAVAHLLYERLSQLPEGDLSRVRANLVKQDTLHQLALKLALSPLLRLGEGEARSGGPNRPSILADALEALIGAVYLDAGYSPAQALVRRLYDSVSITPRMDAVAKDPKTELQEWLQGHKMKLPVYRVIGTLGAAHKQTFDVECEVPDLGLRERGIGGSRRAGEQAAAAAMLIRLKARGGATKASP
jgi:ribonuclease-3